MKYFDECLYLGTQFGKTFSTNGQGPNKLIPESVKPFNKRGHYELCELCHAQCIVKFGWEANVVHADLIPSTVGLRIFQAMPKRVRAKALLMSLVPGKGAVQLMQT